MKPLPELQANCTLPADADVMIDLLADQVAKHSPEVRHRLASTGFPVLDTADRDALVGHSACLLDQLREAAATQMRRPPQPQRRSDRSVDVISSERQRAAPHGRLDFCLEARRAFSLPSTHVRNDTRRRSASPLPQTPTQRPTGARLF